jgi:hypothetical protein
MFEKLFLLVKANAGRVVADNPAIPEKYKESIFNEASSSIIEVLKSQVESGKLKDLVNYFQFSGVSNNSIISAITNKFANRLNKFYGIDPKTAISIAQSIIPTVMEDLIKQTKTEQNRDFELGALISKLNGNRTDMTGVVNKLMIA